MEIPNLPTDNLYKFMAISGVSFVFFFVSLFVIKGSKLNEDLNKITREIEELKFEKQLLAEKDSALKSELIELDSELNRYKYDSTSPDIDLVEYKKTFRDPSNREYYRFLYSYKYEIFPELKIYDDIKQRIKQREENEVLIRLKQNSIIIKHNQTKEDNKSLKIYFWLMLFGVSIGSYLAINGFSLWYRKVQKYQDSKLKFESKKE